MNAARKIPVWVTALIAFALAALAPAASALPSKHPFAIEPGSVHLTTSTTQAAAHADWVVSLGFKHEKAEEANTFNDLRTTVVNLPVGFTGNNTAVPTCPFARLLEEGPRGGSWESNCPPDTQVGQISFDANLLAGAPVLVTTPLYNMEPATGVIATLGLKPSIFTQLLNVTLRPGDAGLTVTSPSLTDNAQVNNITATTWAVPASPIHDAQRGRVCEFREGGVINPGEPLVCYNEGGETDSIPIKPFLANPTSCTGGPLLASVFADSWEEPESWSEAHAEAAPFGGCERVPFNPGLELAPTTRTAESPTGLNVTLVVPQTWSEPETLSASYLKKAVVKLPQGFTINPSAGAGLGACTQAEYEEETPTDEPGEGIGCPSEAKIGTVEVQTPVLAERLHGSVFIAEPFQNPFGSLLALYVVIKVPSRGIVVKAAGKIEADPVTGQLTTTFDETPQAPFERFTLHFNQGATSPLASPPACGTYSGTAQLSPYSEPEAPRLAQSSFAVSEGLRGGACPAGGIPPLHPGLLAGSVNDSAGDYTPFYLRIGREDGEQELTGFSTIMPPGLTGDLTGIPFCPDAAIEAARARTGPHGGQEELQAPSCPAASKVGHTIVEAGVGKVLAQNPGSLYLAGPFHGAPLSLVSITSAVVGPFDLGTVVIRFALQINPITAQVEVSPTGSEPIPYIIKGIVTHVRDIRAYLDRANFILNPTSCNPMSIGSAVTGAGADPSNPADQDSVTVSSPFQVANCANLRFKPQFAVSTEAHTSRADGASLTARVLYPKGSQGTEANIKSVRVELPKALPSRLTTLQKACTAKAFATNPASCPAASVVGHATVHTQILPVPLEGPAYFVSHGGEAFPNLVVVLQGYGVTVELIGDTFINSAGITSSTFASTPDVPFESFELNLPQGKDSALAANGNLCQQSLVMPTAFVAQNGATLDQNTHIEVAGCSNTLAVVSKAAKGHTLTLGVWVPTAGRLSASGRGLSRASKSSGGREELKLALHSTGHRRLTTKIRLVFTPSSGKNRKKLGKSVTVKLAR